MDMYLDRYKIKKNIIFISKLTIALLLFQISILTGSQFLTYLGSIIILWEFILASKLKTLIIVMFLIPSNEYILFAGTSLITLLITTYFFKSIVFFKEKLNLPLLILSIILIIYTLPFGILEVTGTAVKVFLYLHFCISIFIEERKSKPEIEKNNIKIKYVKSIEYLALGIIIASILTLVLNPGMINNRFSLVSTEQSTNLLGILTVFTIGNIVMMIQNNNFRIRKMWMYSLIPLITIGILTQSRTYIFLFGLVVFWVIVFAFIKANSSNKYTLWGFIILLIIVSYFILSNNESFIQIANNAVDRIANPKNNDISGGRTKLYRIYINELIANPSIFFIGTGRLFSPNNKLLAHNIILEQIYYLGVFGNLIIIVLFSYTIKIIRKGNCLLEKSFYGLLPIIIFIAATMGSHTFIGRPDMIRFILSFVAISLFNNNFEKQV